MNSNVPEPAATRATQVSIEINAPIEAVWKALNDAEELTRWFPLEAGTNPDGSVWMSWGGDFRFEGKPEIVEPPHRLRTTAGPGPMATDIFLEARGGKTHVRLVQSGFGAGAEWNEELDATHRGWVFQLRGLKHYLEIHRGTPRRVAWARKIFSLTPAEAWQRLVRGGELVAEGALDGLKHGETFRIRLVTGDTFEGEILANDAPLAFSGITTNWNRAILQIRFDDLPLRGYRDVNLWLSTYGVADAEVRALETRWKGLLDRLFA